MWNLTPIKTSSSGVKIHTLQPYSPKSQEPREKVIWVPLERDLAQSWLTEAWQRGQAKSETEISDYSGELLTAHLISDLTFTKEQTSIIFWQFLKKTAGKYFVVSCKHPRFFSVIYNSMLHNYTDEPFAMIKAQQRYTEIEPMD